MEVVVRRGLRWMHLWERSETIFPKCEIEILNGGSIPITIKMAGTIVTIGKISKFR